MRVIVFGATGVVGQAVLRESLLAIDVEAVLAVGRRPSGVHHRKLTELTVPDVGDLGAVESELAGYDACFYCLGVSSVGMSEADYTRISYDYPMAAARILAKANPDLTFVYVSGAGTNANGRQMWARVKGRAENAIIELFPNGYAFRPGLIQPKYGVRAKSRWIRAAYAVTALIEPLLGRVAPGLVITSDALARAFLRAARTGFPTHVVENTALRQGR
jgi:uncharacterized protein YbjT (DUF2867 family)